MIYVRCYKKIFWNFKIFINNKMSDTIKIKDVKTENINDKIND